MVSAQLATKPEELVKPKAKLLELSNRLSPTELTAAQDLARTLLSRIPTEKEDAARSLLKAR